MFSKLNTSVSKSLKLIWLDNRMKGTSDLQITYTVVLIILLSLINN